MTRRFVAPPAELLDELGRLAERRLAPDEFAAYVAAPMSDDERREIGDLIDWFMRRYPTPAARLAQARRSYAMATALAPRSRRRER